ncbi:MAG: IS1182 family transposase [Lutisporaceae bacterium]
MRYIDGVDRKRKISFPEYIDDYITDDNLVRAIDAFVDSLNIIELGFKNASPSNTGRPGYDPRVILKLYIYGYLNRINSSRRLEAEAYRNIELMWLLRKLVPDHKVISDFRKDNKESINKVFKQFVALCKQWDLFGMEVVAVDGSKFRACNSKKKNYSEKNLNRRIKYLDEKIQKYMSEIDKNDESEQSSRKPTKEEIKKKLKELKNRKELYEGYKHQLEEKDINEISTTDPDARLMAVNNNGIDVCYNVQTVVDNKHNLIVDCHIINNPTDHGQLSEMSVRAKNIFEVDTITALADKGYYNADDLRECEKESITTYVSKQVFSNSTGEREFYSDRFKYDKESNIYICPAGQELNCIRRKLIDENTKALKYKNFKACSKCELKDKCTKNKDGRVITRSIDQDFLDTVDQRTNGNKELYRTRQMIVEHPFGTIKRGWGLSYFLTKKLESVTAEASLAFLAYNMKRVMNIIGVKKIIERLKGLNPLFNLSIDKLPNSG